ncbi:MAG: GNAT family N-acetyltransferase [Oscillospiraceae bacterium]|nr:GNAT family N-acetyltransferase [Oscillospiraceae bacterium]
MIDNICINEIGLNDCKPELLTYFDRYQEARRNWRKQGEQWVLCDDSYTENWDDEKKKEVVKNLVSCINSNGCVLGVYLQDKLIGFASFHGNHFGSNHQYVELNYMHISNGFRGQGLGKRLFSEICEKARRQGIKKLYISANPAEDSIAFYRKVGCTDAGEIIQAIQSHAPFDCQLEYDLSHIK